MQALLGGKLRACGVGLSVVGAGVGLLHRVDRRATKAVPRRRASQPSAPGPPADPRGGHRLAGVAQALGPEFCLPVLGLGLGLGQPPLY
ncbi:MAG: hypothetical protein M3018_04740, partial [Actinomycetota bacterium]|nr:hypothetical protein [Actinomycetota bacterium]